MIPRPVQDYLQANRRHHLDKLFELLRFPSVANHRDGACDRAAAWIVDYLKGLGLKVQVLDAGGQKNVLARLDSPAGPKAPTVLMYAHYDVQPAEPLELWETPAFEPTVRDGRIFARGTSDDKGPLFAQIMAVEAFLKTATPLKANVLLLFEGEEEIGSPTFEKIIAANPGALRADAVIITDSAFFAPGVPAITYALRGVTGMEIFLEGPSHDLHSGSYGGAVTNPLQALVDLAAAMHDEHGRVTIPGFYDVVEPLDEQERRDWAALPFDEKRFANSVGVSELGGGEQGYSTLERLWARPTLEFNGIVGGYAGPGDKTVIPAKASIKLTCRLVGRQDPASIADGVRRFLAEHTPPGITGRVEVRSANRAVMLKKDSPAMQAVKQAMTEVYAAPVAMIRCGASIPIGEVFQRVLGVDAVLAGVTLPDDCIHSPNEHLDLEQFYKASEAVAAMLANIGMHLSVKS